MKPVSTIFTVIIIALGLGIKFARLQRVMNGEPSSAYDVGYDLGASHANGGAKSPNAGYSSGVQGNPFVD